MQSRKTGNQPPSSVGEPFVSKINPKPDRNDYKTTEMYVEDLRRYEKIERLAAIEHDQWCFWSQSLMRDLDERITTISELDKRLMAVDKNHLQSPEHQIARKMFEKHNARNERWESQWCAYTGLTEEVKEHDRLWAKKAYEAINK